MCARQSVKEGKPLKATGSCENIDTFIQICLRDGSNCICFPHYH